VTDDGVAWLILVHQDLDLLRHLQSKHLATLVQGHPRAEAHTLEFVEELNPSAVASQLNMGNATQHNYAPLE
jgi:hypothetical protein